ncbi:MAG TPA: DPP IV N-terminal domain-containing protein, partial [Acidimicrobiales bacterium]|nr:DPP IV N-terminal domain-containing protein [Acidimicrobiales bacterium]
MTRPAEDFPRQLSRSRRFTLGAPRSFTVSPDGERVAFLRSPAGDDPATALWLLDARSGREVEVASARVLLGEGAEELAPEERARRERAREIAGGIVAYACDGAVEHAAFHLDGRLWWVPLRVDGPLVRPRQLPSPPAVFSARTSPDGATVAFLAGSRLCAVATNDDGASEWWVVAEEPDEDVTWGAAEFIAAEEMGRSRGFWWSPDSQFLLAARVDNSTVQTWYTADPANPSRSPEAHRYPAAGTADASVSLWLCNASGDGPRRQVEWASERYPYLVDVHWSPHGPPLLLVEARDHKTAAVLAVQADPDAAGAGGPAGPRPATLGAGAIGTAVMAEMTEGTWVDWPAGVPAWLPGGRFLWTSPDEGTWRLCVDGEPVTPAGLQVREVTSAGTSVLFTASPEPEVVEAWEWSPETGCSNLTGAGSGAAGFGAGSGVATVAGHAQCRVIGVRSMEWHGARVELQRPKAAPITIVNLAEVPVVDPAVRFLRVGERQLSVGVVLPAGHSGGKLPVIMAPYGGPGHQMVLAARSVWLQAQWTADQGFAVVVADGRGTPGRGPAWERAVYRDLAGPALEDQVDALRGAAELVPELD